MTEAASPPTQKKARSHSNEYQIYRNLFWDGAHAWAMSCLMDDGERARHILV